MKINLELNGKVYNADITNPMDISIPVHFDSAQPNTYNVPKATAHAYEDGSFIGDTRRGGSCNFEEYRIIPHCNGTHTECVGHLAFERISVQRVLTSCFIPATLISVNPVDVSQTEETCQPAAKSGDQLLTRNAIKEALSENSKSFCAALIIRTLPNDTAKIAREYGEPPPPYFTTEAMQFIVHTGVKHLLVDVPSVDRTFDGGKMTTHHIFWGLPPESHDVNPDSHSLSTITEMIFVPDSIQDGTYLLNLQIPAFVADAAPSRPILFHLRT